ncbi:RDD family protein [Cohnella nanjingensis]|uniref:RDD family protein n=1 Tax=Cohnella nanjingensis TaxID=1387779 RepID=A0A7X0VES0_9BACL|nr:RDD family protein [Cohnella nanjingensis]MBB6670538.1 RDD family protein [Cohnella nanjingensis]
MNAGFWIRLGASLLDALIIGLPIYLLSMLLLGGNADRLSDALSFLYGLLVPIFWNGYTVGKRICSIRIQKLDGSPPTIGTMLLRTVVSGLIYGFTFGIAVIVSAFMVGLREDKRAIHDFIAGTEVAYAE